MPRKQLKIGITGGIGSGKTVVTKIFSLLGIPVYNADDRAKILQTEDASLKKSIINLIGQSAYTINGDLNRAFIADVVFNDRSKLEALNQLVHPAVGNDYEVWLTKNNDAPYTLKEAALLYEAGSFKALDTIIVVSAPEALRIDRVLQRDQQRTIEQVKAIIAKQLPEAEKVARADFVITNDEKQLVIPQVLAIHEELIKKSLHQ